jgi:hypothetical protein
MEVVLIVLAAVVLAAIAWTLAKKGREQRMESRREEAGELRQTARSHQLEAEREEAEARARAERAQQAKAEAAEHEQRAAELDPDSDDDHSSNGRVTERGPVEGRTDTGARSEHRSTR